MNNESGASSKSKRFRDLEREIEDLREHLLPSKFSATGMYSQRVVTRTLAFRVFSHAEFEAYLEDRVQETYRAAMLAFQQKGCVSKVISCMLAFSGQTMHGPPESINPPQPSQAKKWGEGLELSKKVEKAANAGSG